MIYTVTFNPAIDYVMYINELEKGKTNRSELEEIYFGGKGINVSTILAQLEIDTTALGFIAGFTGDALDTQMKKLGVKTDFIRLNKGCTRINIKLKSDKETEINAQGPDIPKEKIDELFKKLEKIQAGDTLVLAGSVPNTLPQDIYEKILEKLANKNIRFVVDATQDLLLNVLKYKPFLIKPNKNELEEIFNRELNSDEEIAAAALELKNKGAVNVLVSLGKNGALLVDEFGKIYKQAALGGKPVNTVGAGDSMVAGFIAGAEKDYEYALLLGSAAGGATACNKGLALKEDIMALL
ncbi:MAG: 1-phosphofructokinase [Acutalibacteraceae bacterium]